MEIILKIFNLLFTNIIAKPQFFIGLIVFIGYLAIGRKIYDALGGFIKAAIGFMILNVGSSGLVKNFDPILKGLAQKYQISAVVIDSIQVMSANVVISLCGQLLRQMGPARSNEQ